MVRHLKALGLVLGCLAIGCAARTVTVVRDYVPILFLDPREPRAIGKMECDVMNHPVIYVHPAISLARRQWVIVHEKIHVTQTQRFGGCEPFQQRMVQDSMFRLDRESEAYCGVLQAQRFLQAEVNPSYDDIVGILSEKYYSAYELSAIGAALRPCRPTVGGLSGWSAPDADGAPRRPRPPTARQ